MDFTYFCKKVEMDNIRAKLRSLPTLPTLKNFKLSKSLPKLNSRKIFRSSHEDLNNDTKHKVSVQHLDPNIPPPPADFIRYTPSRISTISSLVLEENNEYFKGSNTYRSAESVDDDYASSLPQRRRSLSRPISPITLPSTKLRSATQINDNTYQQTFTQSFQKRIKDFSDFKFKHLFAKKTVVRKDHIEVDRYVQRYTEDLVHEKQEQERHDEEIQDNYRIQFTISRQNTNESIHSEFDKPEKIDRQNIIKTVGENSGDESGMETSPPTRKPGIASTRFSKVLKPVKRMSIEYDYEMEETSINKLELKSETTKLQSLKTRLTRLGSLYKESDAQTTEGKINIYKDNSSTDIHIEEKHFKKDESIATNNALIAMKNNCKRFKKSIMQRQQQQTSTDESGDEGSPSLDVKKLPTKKPQRFKAQLRKFRSKDDFQDTMQTNQFNVDVKSNINNKLRNWKKSLKKNSCESPNAEKTIEESFTNQLDSKNNLTAHTNITNELHKWKKSLRKENQTDEENTLDKHKRSDTIIKKLKYIRARKNMNSAEDIEEVSSINKAESTSFEKTKSKNLEEKFNQARQQTLKKVNEKVLQLKTFQTQQQQKRKQDKEGSVEKDVINFPPTITRHVIDAPNKTKDEVNDEIIKDENFKLGFSTNKTCAKWTTKPIFSESLETDDTDNELPRVLIHQDNSDFFESTLIISVTRPASLSPPKITEITYEDQTKNNQTFNTFEWNQDVISEFNSTTLPEKSVSDLPKSLNISSSHFSSNENAFYNAFPTNQNSSSDPWKINSKYSENKLYKCQSADIFDVSKISIVKAFDNFDEELRNEPVVKISNCTSDIVNKDYNASSEVAADDDNSSLETNFSVKQTNDFTDSPVNVETLSKTLPLRKIGNSQESLLTQLTQESEDPDSDDDYDRPPSAAPSPPPSIPPPAPPLPVRRSLKTSQPVRNSKNFTPTSFFPTTKPPLPKNKPLRTNSMQQPLSKIIDRPISMTRISKPLVKTSSLRLTYNEQMKLTDVGQVTKLISRFEQPLLKEQQQKLYDNHDENELVNIEKQSSTNPNILEDHKSSSITKLTIIEPLRTFQKNNINIDGNLLPDVKIEDRISLNSSTFKSFNISTNIPIKNVNCAEISEAFKTPLNSSKNSLNTDTNFNYSCPNSEYSSPLTYPSSLIGSPEVTPTLDRRYKETGEAISANQKIRSVARETDNYYSFDSDEENSYYSISSSSNSRYVVEI